MDIGDASSHRLLAVLGPTASGKSSLAINVALQVGGEIVNCDAMQMIRHLNIGTAKPNREERELVPHHLFDTIDPDHSYNAGAYMKDAREVCQLIAARGMIPIVVGGTGLYLRVLLEGIFEGPGQSEEIRANLERLREEKGIAHLYGMLTERDAAAASRIQPSDVTRIVRALEVERLTGEKISELQARRTALQGFEVLKIGIKVPRKDLYDRINRRVEAMFREGFLEEVESILGLGYSPSSKGFEALGYGYAIAILEKKMTQEQAIELTQRDTRRYAKRQLTWFRKEKGVRWLRGPGENPDLAGKVVSLLEGEEE